jgi:hypothetical protein
MRPNKPLNGTAYRRQLVATFGRIMKNTSSLIFSAIERYDFHAVSTKPEGVCCAIWKRQTWNSNRAVVLVQAPEIPEDPTQLFKKIRKEVAFRCGFFPVFYGIGIQVVLVLTGVRPDSRDLSRFVDRYDNNWSIIQSIFVTHIDGGLISDARTWGQFLSGKFQDAIAIALKDGTTRNLVG